MKNYNFELLGDPKNCILKLINISKFYMTIYYCKLNFIQKKLKTFFYHYFLKFLHLIRLIFILFFRVKNKIKILFLFFYFFTFTLKKNISLLKIDRFIFLEKFLETITFNLSKFYTVNI